MKSDIEIAQETKLTEISKIAAKLGYSKDELETPSLGKFTRTI